MNVIWKTVWRDVFVHKGRTVQVVLSMAVGIFAVGLTLGMFVQMNERMSATWRSATPSHIHVGVGEGVTDSIVQAIGNMPGIAGAEGHINTAFRLKMLPGRLPW
jgi:putative ABC transport system permease protein